VVVVVVMLLGGQNQLLRGEPGDIFVDKGFGRGSYY